MRASTLTGSSTLANPSTCGPTTIPATICPTMSGTGSREAWIASGTSNATAVITAAEVKVSTVDPSARYPVDRGGLRAPVAVRGSDGLELDRDHLTRGDEAVRRRRV